MSKCREVIVYKIKAENLDEFQKNKDTLIKDAYSLKGLISSETDQSTELEGVFVDTMFWESPEASEKADPEFMKLPGTKKFLGMLEGPPLYRGLFLVNENT